MGTTRKGRKNSLEIIMKVTGYQLQHTLRELKAQRDIAAGQFSESLYAFEDEDKTPPTVLMKSFVDAERKIAILETHQQRYNLMVEVQVLSETMPLSQAIKMVGGAGRAEKMWRTCAADKGRERYGMREMTRNRDEMRAQRQVSISDAMELSRTSAKFASALRTAIAVGNGTEIEIEGLDASLFE